MTIYVVRRGDSLSAIARRYGTTVETLSYANQLAAPDLLVPGQALVIPVESTVHVVRRGETAFRIAADYGVTLAALRSANPGIGDGSRLQPGQRLRIPLSVPRLGRVLTNGYITDAGDDTLRETLPYLSFLSPFSYRTDETGELTATYSVSTALSGENGAGNLLTLTNLRAAGGFSSAAAHAVLTDETAQENFLDNVLALLEGGDWTGVNLDFEYVWPFDRGSYNQFLRRFAETLHRRGYLLITALAPKTSGGQQGLLYTAHDYPVHGEAADYVIPMTYEWGYTYGPAMAVAPIDKVRRVLDYAVSVIPAGKILLGVPNYGYDWTLPFVQGSAARPLSNVQAVTLAGAVGAEIRFDGTAQSPWFRYTDGQGRTHEVWFEDARSLRAKYLLVEEYGLAGVSWWNLNRLFRTNFLVLESLFSVEKPMSN